MIMVVLAIVNNLIVLLEGFKEDYDKMLASTNLHVQCVHERICSTKHSNDTFIHPNRYYQEVEFVSNSLFSLFSAEDILERGVVERHTYTSTIRNTVNTIAFIQKHMLRSYNPRTKHVTSRSNKWNKQIMISNLPWPHHVVPWEDMLGWRYPTLLFLLPPWATTAWRTLMAPPKLASDL